METAVSVQSSNRQLKSFGLTVGSVFLFMGAWPVLWRGQGPRWWALILGGALLPSGLIMPVVLRKPYQLWMRLAHALGWINTKIVLSIMFYAVFTPAAIIMRLIGVDPMNRSLQSSADTYRLVRHPRSASHMKHQF